MIYKKKGIFSETVFRSKKPIVIHREKEVPVIDTIIAESVFRL